MSAIVEPNRLSKQYSPPDGVTVLSFALSITSLGMLIAGIARTYAQANALANILMYTVASA